MTNKKGVLVIVSGPAGTGKGTVIGRVGELRGDLRYSVSATTRAPRPGETDGVNYYFKSREEFETMIGAGAFLEYAEYVGNLYGTPAGPVDESLSAGLNVILEIEVQGAAQVMARRPDAVSVFLAPPSLAELESRLRGRGTEDDATIRRRLDTARGELALAKGYQYIIVNDDVETAARELDAVITAGRCRSMYYPEGENLL